RLHGLDRLRSFVGDYRDVDISGEAVVYCDPPYRGTEEYTCGKFDHDAFYEWLRTRDFPVYVSEYSMPADFVAVWERKRVVRARPGKPFYASEKVFVHERWRDGIYKFDLFG
ncbi:MAG: hypothetical protein LUD72_06210, partial [Bacteroidales bacterium]|nr:hypothetical protein [Bacteroidales bacterium]